MSAPAWAAMGASLLVALSGCAKKTQDAVVTQKEYIPAHVEGTEYKEHELDHEQWLAHLELQDGQRVRTVLDKEEWEGLAVGDRVRANYWQGKYTGTIWASEIQKKEK